MREKEMREKKAIDERRKEKDEGGRGVGRDR